MIDAIVVVLTHIILDLFTLSQHFLWLEISRQVTDIKSNDETSQNPNDKTVKSIEKRAKKYVSYVSIINNIIGRYLDLIKQVAKLQS